MSARKLIRVIFFIAPTALPFPVHAQQTNTAEFNVLIEILEACDIAASAASDIDFGSHVRNAGAPVTAVGTLTVNCTQGTDYNIGLNQGLNATGTPAGADNRRMTNGTDFVPYGLYQDAAHQTFWGDIIGSDTFAGVGVGVAEDLPVYGRVPSTNSPPGSYIDTVTATITY